MAKVTKKKAAKKKAARKKTKGRNKAAQRPVPQRVAIVAMGDSKRTFVANASVAGGSHALYDEVWCINNMGGVIHHDLLFHMDDCRIQEARAAAEPDGNIARMLDWLKSHPGFITSRAYPEYPGAIEFPLEEVLNQYKCTYFNNTVAYAFVYAMYIGVPHVTLFGCDYSYPNNAHKAEEGRACLEFWIGSAVTRGMQVEVGEGSTLLDISKPDDQRFYGYDTVHIELDRDEKTGDMKVEMRERDVSEIPTAKQIEERYNHDRTPKAD
jgi:hypothetical protein